MVLDLRFKKRKAIREMRALSLACLIVYSVKAQLVVELAVGLLKNKVGF